MPDPGALHLRLVFQSPPGTVDGLGDLSADEQTDGNWTDEFTRWGKREQFQGSERERQERDEAQAPARFTVRYDKAIEPKWRIKETVSGVTHYYEIESAVDADGSRTWTTIWARKLGE